MLHYDDTNLHECTYDVNLGNLGTHDSPCSFPSLFDVGGTSSHTSVKRYVIEENSYLKKNPLLFHYDIHIHGCIDETYLIHLKSSCFLCSLFGSDFGGDSSFTSWMKERMANYIDVHYIFLDQHYRTWDPNLCHWSRFDWSLEACMHLANGSLLTWRYQHFHDFLMRRLFDVHYYYVVIYFDDIYYAFMMFGRMHTRKWDLGILFQNSMGWRALLSVGLQCKQWDPGIVFSPIDFKFFGKQAVQEMDSQFNKVI